MWDSVSSQFLDFSKPMEGMVHWMYQDHIGKVTIGVGNLIDSEAAALGLPGYGAPYYRKDGSGAAVTDADIRADWNRIKGDPSLAGRWPACEEPTALRISVDSIRVLVARKAAEFEAYLIDHAADPDTQVRAFADFATWPADAQLGLLSMAWAMGPAFADDGRWKKFRRACVDRDWFGAAAECRMSNTWLTKRNAVNRGLFRNAAWAETPPAEDPSTLFLPIGVVRPTIELGDVDSTDTYVADLQSWLAFLNYPVDQTGQFDQQTYDAVVAFQTDEQFTPDGRVGPLTWAALGYQVPAA